MDGVPSAQGPGSRFTTATLVEVAGGDVVDGCDVVVVGDVLAVVADSICVVGAGGAAFDEPVHPTRSTIAKSTRRMARGYALPERVRSCISRVIHEATCSPCPTRLSDVHLPHGRFCSS